MKKLNSGQRCLIVHIGTGKTGSTSIQHFLGDNSEKLARMGVAYWGLNLEHSVCDSKRKAWQTPEGLSRLQEMSDQEALADLSEALSNAIDQWNKSESSIAIWSQEAIYNRPQVYIPAISQAASRYGILVHITAFARNHRDYALSAYRQWGISHKHYPGPVLGFSDWCQHYFPSLEYGKKLRIWREEFGDSFSLLDYDLIADVVEEFILDSLARVLPASMCGELLAELPCARRNAHPNETLQLLHAIYNSLFAEPKLPHSFRELMRSLSLSRHLNFDVPWDHFLPKGHIVDEVFEALRNDREVLAGLLGRRQELGRALPPAVDSMGEESDLCSRVRRLEQMVSLISAIALEQQEIINGMKEKISD